MSALAAYTYDRECGLHDIESLVDHGSLQQIAKATAYMDVHGTASPRIQASCQIGYVISSPSSIDTEEKTYLLLNRT